MRDEKRTAQLFIAAWAVLFALGLLGLMTHDKLALHRQMNAWHTPWLDAFFARFTHLADGLVPTGLALLLLLKDLRSFLMMGLSCGVSALIAQGLKQGPFAHMHRPSMFRDRLAGLHWVEGIDLHAHNSFPSGHSTAAFAMCFALAVVIGRPAWGAALALLAGLLAYSRIYLSQHFLQDAVLGSLIGTATAAFFGWLLWRGPWSRRGWVLKRPFARAAA